MPKILMIRLYCCENGHQFETAETIVGSVQPIQREKKLLYRASVANEVSRRRREEDF